MMKLFGDNGRIKWDSGIIVIVIGAVSLVILILLLIKLQRTLFQGPLSEKERVARLLAQDKLNLNRKDATEFETYAALIRLSQGQDPQARTLALEYTKSPSRMIREGVANALGYFDDPEAMARLAELTSDPEKTVRLQAIQGFGHKQGLVRESAILQILKNPNLSPEEEGAALNTLIQVVSTPQSRNQAIQRVVDLIKKSKDMNLVSQMMMMIVATAPREPKVIETLKYVLSKKSTPSIDSMGVRHLAALNDPWLKTNLARFAASTDVATRMGAIQAVHMVCPSNRWKILEGIYRGEPDRGLLGLAIGEVRTMPGQEAQDFIQQMLNQKVFRNEDIATAEKVLNDLKADKTGKDPCK